MTPRVSVKITARPAAPKPPVVKSAKPTATKPSRPALTANQEALRRETLAADRRALASVFNLQVAIPLQVQGFPRPQFEFTFHPDRDWRYDVFYREARLCIDLDGGLTGRRNPQTGAWEHGKRGGHVSVSGYERDRCKDNEAVCLGMTVLRFTREQLVSGEARDWTERALRRCGFRSMK